MDRSLRVEARLAAVALALVLVGSRPSALAAQRVSFDEAIFAVSDHPEVRAPRRELSEREARDTRIGGTAQATAVSAGPGRRFTPDEERGFEGQFAITQSWNLAALGERRREAAADERATLSAEVRAVALAARLEAARAWVDVHTLERLLGLVEEQLALAGETAAAVERALALGVATAADLADAEAFVAEVRSASAMVEGELHEAAIRLSVAMGRSPSGDLRTRGATPTPLLPDEDAFGEYVLRADALPRAEALRLAELAARTRAREARAEQGPLLTVGAQAQSEPPAAWGILGLAGITLNLFDRGMRTRSKELALAARLEEEQASAALRARAEVARAIHDLSHARNQLTILVEELRPTVERLVAQRERARAVGAGTVFELLAARRAALRVEELHARADGAFTWAAVRLWLLLAELERVAEER